MNSEKEAVSFLPFFETMRQTPLAAWAGALEQRTRSKLTSADHGDCSKWLQALAQIPKAKPSRMRFNQPVIQIGNADDLTLSEREALRENLKALHPWRKGPFELFGVLIDAEWRSDLKWERVERAIQPLAGRHVLDLGCGNGYYLWRMAGCGAQLALGADPSLLFTLQFQVFQNYAAQNTLAVLPLGAEDLPENLAGFDTVFSMGLLYHRRDPLEHLSQLRGLLRKGGELVLETLIIDGVSGEILKPGERYAKMRNVWNVPAPGTVESWLRQSGFKNVRCADVTLTTAAEQRKTEWMQFESLEDFLDAQDPSKTVEGFPAPKRALFTAEKA